MAEQDLNRPESATPHKLLEARKRGQVARSTDFVAALVFAAAMTYFAAQGWTVTHDLFRLMRALLGRAGHLDASIAAIMPLIADAIKTSLMALVPFFIVLMLAAIVGNLVQTGPVLSLHPLSPDFNRLNPINGFRKIFSLRSLFESMRACLKLLLLGLVAFQALNRLSPQFFHVSTLSAYGHVQFLLGEGASLGLKMAAMLGLIALIDIVYVRREFAKKMSMSKREIRDEFRQREGDPRIRARLRELQREMRKRSAALVQTRHADVVITNPTHVAVALRYQHGEMQSPQIIAKGAGVLAAVMRKIAARHQIPVIQNPPLARQLFRQVGVEQHVPMQMYAEVARIIVWVFAMRQARERAAGRP